MEQIVMGALVLGVVVGVRRKQIFQLRWQPDSGTWVAVGTGLLAFLFSGLLLMLEPNSTVSRLLLYGGIWVLCGVLIPWGYVLIVERDSARGLGLRREKLLQSLLISLGLGLFFSLVILFETDWATVELGQVTQALAVLVLAGGLFELFLYYGFIHIRMERAFGPLPAIFGTSILYVLWHVGTQLPMESNPWLGAVKLFAVGIMFQSVFSLTYNLLIIWPLFFGVGVMIDFMVNIGELDTISSQLPFAMAAMLSMLLGVALIHAIAKLRERHSPANDEGLHRVEVV